MRRTTVVTFSLLLVLSLFLAGCGQQVTAEEIVARVQETVEGTRDAHAVVSVDVNAQGIQMSVTAEVWEKMPNLLRAEVLSASESEYVGMMLLNDGQQGWLYEPARNQVLVGQVEEMDTPLPQQALTEMREVIQAVLDVSDVELAGEEVVVGREAYKLTLRPKEGAEQEIFPGDGTATLWVDKDQWFILKATYEGGMFGVGTMEIQSFELNPGLPDDIFAFQVPEGVEVVDLEAQEPVMLTLDQAKERAGFPLLVPAYVPADATLVQVLEVMDSYVLGYDHSPEVSFTISQGPELVRSLPMGATQNVTVRGHAGTAITDETMGATFLSWEEGDLVFALAGRISLEEALKVAESLQ